MYQNSFTVVGRVERIIRNPKWIRYILSEFGPIKVRVAAEIRDPAVIAVVASPRGFKEGDVLSLTGLIVFDEKTGANVCVVSKNGATRISSAPAQAAATAPTAKPAAAPAAAVAPAAAARPAAPPPVVNHQPVPVPRTKSGVVITDDDSDCAEAEVIHIKPEASAMAGGAAGVPVTVDPDDDGFNDIPF